MKKLSKEDKEYQELVFKSVTKQYTEQDRIETGLEPTEKVAVYSQSCWTLYRYGKNYDSKHLPVLIIPSLINKSYIMDLLPGHSMIESMVNKGLDVFIIDWGTPDESIGHYGFAEYVGIFMKRAVRQVKKIRKVDQIQMTGQCIGGLMAALYGAHSELSKDIKRMFLLTAPLDMENSGMLFNWTSDEAFDVEKMTSAFEAIVPSEFFHASFPFLDVRKQLTKYSSLQENFKIPGFKKIWKALDIWANDNVPFTKAAFLDLIISFYQENSFKNGKFMLNGEKIGIKDIKMPVLAIAASEDHVFTENAAAAIKDSQAAKDKKLEYHVMNAGHVTLIAVLPVREETFKLINNFFSKK